MANETKNIKRGGEKIEKIPLALGCPKKKAYGSGQRVLYHTLILAFLIPVLWSLRIWHLVPSSLIHNITM